MDKIEYVVPEAAIELSDAEDIVLISVVDETFDIDKDGSVTW